MLAPRSASFPPITFHVQRAGHLRGSLRPNDSPSPIFRTEKSSRFQDADRHALVLVRRRRNRVSLGFMSLSPCIACARHVRSTDMSCPFCGVDLSVRTSKTSISPKFAGRLSRAALVFGGLALAGAAEAACNGVEAPPLTPPSAPAPDAGVTPSSVTSDAASSEAPSTRAGETSTPDAGVDASPMPTQAVVAIYGAPPPPKPPQPAPKLPKK